MAEKIVEDLLWRYGAILGPSFKKVATTVANYKKKMGEPLPGFFSKSIQAAASNIAVLRNKLLAHTTTLRGLSTETDRYRAYQLAANKARETARRTITNLRQEQNKLKLSEGDHSKRLKSIKEEIHAVTTKRNRAVSMAKTHGQTIDKLTLAKRKEQGAMAETKKSLAAQTTAYAALGAKAAAALAATVVGAVLLTTALGKLLGSFLSFERSMTEVATIMEEHQLPLLHQMKRAVLDISAAYGLTAKDTSKALYEILSAQMPVTKATQVLEQSAKLARAGFIGLSTSADAITTILNSYGMSAWEAEKASDMLFFTVRKGKTTLAQLAPQIGRIAGSAHQAGMSLEGLSSLMATLTQAGMKTGIAVTTVGSILRNFLVPSVQAQELALEEFGVVLDEATMKAEGFTGIMQLLATASAQQLMKVFPQIRAMRGVMTIQTQLTAASELYRQAQIQQAITSEALARVDKTLFYSLEQLGASFKALWITLSETIVRAEGFIKAIKIAVTAVKWLTDALADMTAPKLLGEEEEGSKEKGYAVMRYTEKLQTLIQRTRELQDQEKELHAAAIKGFLAQETIAAKQADIDAKLASAKQAFLNSLTEKERARLADLEKRLSLENLLTESAKSQVSASEMALANLKEERAVAKERLAALPEEISKLKEREKILAAEMKRIEKLKGYRKLERTYYAVPREKWPVLFQPISATYREYRELAEKIAKAQQKQMDMGEKIAAFGVQEVDIKKIIHGLTSETVTLEEKSVRVAKARALQVSTAWAAILSGKSLSMLEAELRTLEKEVAQTRTIRDINDGLLHLRKGHSDLLIDAMEKQKEITREITDQIIATNKLMKSAEEKRKIIVDLLATESERHIKNVQDYELSLKVLQSKRDILAIEQTRTNTMNDLMLATESESATLEIIREKLARNTELTDRQREYALRVSTHQEKIQTYLTKIHKIQAAMEATQGKLAKLALKDKDEQKEKRIELEEQLRVLYEQYDVAARLHMKWKKLGARPLEEEKGAAEAMGEFAIGPYELERLIRGMAAPMAPTIVYSQIKEPMERLVSVQEDALTVLQEIRDKEVATGALR